MTDTRKDGSTTKVPSGPFATPPENADDPRVRLVLAVIGQIERHGLASVTVRTIADAAKLNIAAVNYYFRSKDALVAAAMEQTARHTVEDSQATLAKMDAEPLPALTEFLSYILEGALLYPRISRAHFDDSLNLDGSGAPFARHFQPVVMRLRDCLRRAVPGLSETEASHRATAAIAGVFFPALVPGLFSGLSTFDTPKERRAYVAGLAATALMPPGEGAKGPAKRRK